MCQTSAQQDCSRIKHLKRLAFCHVQVTGGKAPEARSYHAMAAFGDAVYVFGGCEQECGPGNAQLWLPWCQDCQQERSVVQTMDTRRQAIENRAEMCVSSQSVRLCETNTSVLQVRRGEARPLVGSAPVRLALRSLDAASIRRACCGALAATVSPEGEIIGLATEERSLHQPYSNSCEPRPMIIWVDKNFGRPQRSRPAAEHMVVFLVHEQVSSQVADAADVQPKR